jgi:hypothetical protein
VDLFVDGTTLLAYEWFMESNCRTLYPRRTTTAWSGRGAMEADFVPDKYEHPNFI